MISDGPMSQRVALVAQLIGPPAGTLALLDDGYVVAHALQAKRGREAAEAGADDDDLHAITCSPPSSREAEDPAAQVAIRRASTTVSSASSRAALAGGEQQRAGDAGGRRPGRGSGPRRRRVTTPPEAITGTALRATATALRVALGGGRAPVREGLGHGARRRGSRNPSTSAQLVAARTGHVDRGHAGVAQQPDVGRRQPEPDLLHHDGPRPQRGDDLGDGGPDAG